jgi:hypothetical protein
MKTWIIVLAIVFVILKLVQQFLANYIRNDRTERVRYYYLDGATTLGVIHGIVSLLSTLVGCTDLILLFIYLLNLV